MTQLEHLQHMSADEYLRSVQVSACPMDAFAGCDIHWCHGRDIAWRLGNIKSPCKNCAKDWLNSEVKK